MFVFFLVSLSSLYVDCSLSTPCEDMLAFVKMSIVVNLEIYVQSFFTYSSSSSSLSRAAKALKDWMGLSAIMSLASAGLLEAIFLLLGLTFKVS